MPRGSGRRRRTARPEAPAPRSAPRHRRNEGEDPRGCPRSVFGIRRRMPLVPPIRPSATSTRPRRSRTTRRRSAPTRRRSTPASRTSGDRRPHSRDGGQTADDRRGGRHGTFLDGATRTLDLALYDVRLDGRERQRSARARRARRTRRAGAVALQPRPPAPDSRPAAARVGSRPHRDAPVRDTRDLGRPDLMHHKYVVRDGPRCCTAAKLDERLVDAAGERRGGRRAPPSSRVAFTLNFDELWDGASVERCGTSSRGLYASAGRLGAAVVLPRPRRAARAPDRQAAGPGKRRIRIASPVLTSGPMLGTLSRDRERAALRRRRRHRDSRWTRSPGQWRSPRRVARGRCRCCRRSSSWRRSPGRNPPRGRREPARLHAREDHGGGRRGIPRQLQPVALRRAERRERARAPRRATPTGSRRTWTTIRAVYPRSTVCRSRRQDTPVVPPPSEQAPVGPLPP